MVQFLSFLVLHASSAIAASPAQRTPPVRGLQAIPTTGQSGLSASAESAILDKHNLIRGTVKAPCTASDMETMVWDKDLAQEAQAYVDTCFADHDLNRGSVGENIAYRTFQESTFGIGYTTDTLLGYVQDWFDEAANIDFTLTSPGVKSKLYEIPQTACSFYTPATADRGECSIGYYTQMTWARTNAIGCGARACLEGLTLRGFKYAAGIVFLCRYTPMGNTISPVPGAGFQRPWACGECCQACSTRGDCSSTGLCPIGVFPENPLDMSCNPTTTTTNTSTTLTTTATTTNSSTSTTTSTTNTTTTTTTTSTSTSTSFCRCVTTLTTTTSTTRFMPCTPETCPQFLMMTGPSRRLSLVLSESQMSMEEHKSAIVGRHNSLRAAVEYPCTASDMETLAWDDDLASAAQTYANKCVPQADSTRGSVGENLVTVRVNGSLETADFLQLVQDWYDEEADVAWSPYSNTPSSKMYKDPQASCKLYDLVSGACVIDHYTQIVWARSSKIGCGISLCGEELDVNETGTVEAALMIFVCRYSPLAADSSLSQALVHGGLRILPPFTVGLKCAACPLSCSVYGLCDSGSKPARCNDTLSARSPLIMYPESYQNCSSLIDRWSGWCSLYEQQNSYRRCRASCGHCSISSGMGPRWCHTTTTTTTSTTTTLTTTSTTSTSTTSSVTTTSRDCIWVCYKEYPGPLTDAPTVPVTTITTSTTSTTSTPKTYDEVGLVMTGSLVLTVPYGANFSNDTIATNAVAAGIADALGVPDTFLALTFRSWSGQMRRLWTYVAVTVEYTVTIPASASGSLKIEAVRRAGTVSVLQLTEAVQERVTAAKGSDYVVSVNSKTETKIRTIAGPVQRPRSTGSSLPSARFRWWASLVGLAFTGLFFEGGL